MKINILSDIHLEFGPYDINTSGDILILAGDIIPSANIYSHHLWFTEISKRYNDIIFIAGNHEFYNNEYFTTINELKAFFNEFDKIYFLDNESIIINDVLFIGSTLWGDYDRGNPLTMHKCKEEMNDHQIIYYNDRKFTPEDAYNIHLSSKEFLANELSKTEKKKCVITHHVPSYRSLSSEFKGSYINGAFFGDVENLIYEYQPDFWLHGHVHSSWDYSIGKTQIKCNPRGYVPHSINKLFEPDKSFII